MKPYYPQPESSSRRSGLNLLHHLRQFGHWYVLLALMLVIIMVYYRLQWHTFKNFVKAIDQYPQFMFDFKNVYYPMSKQILEQPKPVPGYYYTAFFALALAPIGTLTLPSAMVVWGAIQLACLAAMCIVSFRLLKLPPLGIVLYVGQFVTSFPILHNMRWGQVSVLITTCVIAAFLASNKNNRVLAGVLLACASAIKFYPAFFILYFVLKGDVRTCVAFGLALIVFYLVFPATVLGFSNWFEFEKAVSTAIGNAQWISQDINSQYIIHVGLRWFAIIFHRSASNAMAHLLTIVSYFIALSNVAMVWLLQRRASCEKKGLPIVIIFLSIPFVVKSSWPHYFVYLPWCQAAVFSYYASSLRSLNRWGMVLGGLSLVSVMLSSVFVFNLFSSWETYSTYAMLFLANLLLLISLYATIAVPTIRSAEKQGFSPETA